MIEPTDEMYAVFEYAGDIPEGVARLLALVERDYDVSPKPAPVEHRAKDGTWWNHYAEQWETECVCGETFADGYRDRADDRLLDHVESSS